MSDDQPYNPPEWLVPPPASPLDSPPPSVVVEAEFGARSRRGPLRSVNDDHYLIMRLGRHQETLLTSISEPALPRRFDEHGYGMAVADGTGGLGEAASRLAISALVHLAIDFGRWHVRIDEPVAEEVLDRAQRFFRSIDSTLLQASRDGPRTLQTTLTAVFTAGTDLFFAHVGHSRAYVFRDNTLMQLTHDHTLDRERPRKAPNVDVTSSPRDLHHILTETLGGRAAGRAADRRRALRSAGRRPRPAVHERTDRRRRRRAHRPRAPLAQDSGRSVVRRSSISPRTQGATTM